MGIHLLPTRDARRPLVEPGNLLHHVADLCVSVAADVTLAALDAQLAAAGQWLPIDGHPEATLGDLLLRDSTGPLRLGFGGWRDLLLGLQFIDGDGQLISAGGMTVKNVAGYDLTKFLVGSAGCFGTPVTMTLRTYRRPEGALLVEIRSPQPSALNALLLTDLRPQWIVTSAAGTTLGYVGRRRQLEFWEASVDSSLAEHGVGQIRGLPLEREREQRRRLWPDHNVHALVPPATAGTFVADVDPWVLDPVHGKLLGTADDPGVVAANWCGRGASAVAWAGERPLAWHLPPSTVELLKRLKDSFDPRGTLPPLPLASPTP